MMDKQEPPLCSGEEFPKQCDALTLALDELERLRQPPPGYPDCTSAIMAALGQPHGEVLLRMIHANQEELARLRDELERRRPTLRDHGHDAPCLICGEPCSALAGNPSLWPLRLGNDGWHHTGCVNRELERRRPRGLEWRESTNRFVAATAIGDYQVWRSPKLTGREDWEAMIFPFGRSEWSIGFDADVDVAKQLCQQHYAAVYAAMQAEPGGE
jgi:hypothetical protein